MAFPFSSGDGSPPPSLYCGANPCFSLFPPYVFFSSYRPEVSTFFLTASSFLMAERVEPPLPRIFSLDSKHQGPFLLPSFHQMGCPAEQLQFLKVPLLPRPIPFAVPASPAPPPPAFLLEFDLYGVFPSFYVLSPKSFLALSKRDAFHLMISLSRVAWGLFFVPHALINRSSCHQCRPPREVMVRQR